MMTWEIHFKLNAESVTKKIGYAKINRGIFQEDALKPLTIRLNQLRRGYRLGRGKNHIIHLFYMNALKIHARDYKDLAALLNSTTSFRTDIRMNFGLHSCRSKYVAIYNCPERFFQGAGSCVTHGMPQGSILAPILFDVYANDRCLSFNSCLLLTI